MSLIGTKPNLGEKGWTNFTAPYFGPEGLADGAAVECVAIVDREFIVRDESGKEWTLQPVQIEGVYLFDMGRGNHVPEWHPSVIAYLQREIEDHRRRAGESDDLTKTALMQEVIKFYTRILVRNGVVTP